MGSFSRCLGLTVLVVIVLLSGVFATAYAHEFFQLNVIVNQIRITTTTQATPTTTLVGATTTTLAAPNIATARTNNNYQRKINNILKKECDPHGIYMRVTMSKWNTLKDPKWPDGKPAVINGDITDNDPKAVDPLWRLTQLAKKNEIKNEGYKIWVVKRYFDKPDTDPSGSIDGQTYEEESVSVVREPSGIYGGPNMWLHEIVHGLTDIDDIEDETKADNLMYGYLRKPDGTLAKANRLTKDQCELILKGMKKRTTKTDQTLEQKNQPKTKKKKHTMVDPPEQGALEGTASDIANVETVLDNDLVNPTDNSLEIDIHVNSMLPPVPLTIYSVWLDLDNNALTGDAAGFDVLLEERVTSPTDGLVTLYELPDASSPKVLDPLEVELTGKKWSGLTSGETINSTQILSRVLLSELGPLSNPIRIMVTADDGVLSDSLGPESVATVAPTEPTLTLNPIEGSPGGLVNAVGTGFSASTPYVILVDDTEVLSAVTGPLGALDVDFPVPFRFPGDYLVDVIDLNGEVEVAVLRVPLTDTGKNTILQVSAGFLFAILGLALLKRRRSQRRVEH